MNIILGTPPSEGSKWGTDGLPVLGLAYLAGSIAHIPEIQLKIVDGLAEGLTTDQMVERILAYSPDLFGISATSHSIMRAIKLLTALKREKPDILTIAGGYHATAFDKLMLEEIPQLDMVLRGEADRSFPQLCQRLLEKKPLSGIDGLSIRNGKEIIRGKAQYIKNLDTIPFPDRTAFTCKSYWKSYGGFKLLPLSSPATVISSRGCAHNCTFCSKLTPGSRVFRMRSAENVFSELQHLYNSGYRLVGFVDENFSQNVPRVRKICDLILQHKLDMRFAFQGTLHNLSQSDLDLMHRAGFDIVAVGVESGSDAQLKRYKKAASSEEIGQGILRAKKANMFVLGFFIHGGPGETEEDCNASKRFIRKIKPHMAGTGVLTIQPGSRLWEAMTEDEPSVTSIESSRIRMIHSFPGQLTQKTIEGRIKSFQAAFILSCFHWRQILEFIRLFRNNPTVRYGITHLFRRKSDRTA